MGDGERRLALEAIHMAFKDLHAEPPKPGSRRDSKVRARMLREHFFSRLTAAVWLASAASSPWFEIARVERSVVMAEHDWTKAAVQIWLQLQRSTPRFLDLAGVRPHHIRLLREALVYHNALPTKKAS